MSDRPIAVFDSGLGGLTVVSALYKLMPHEHFGFFADRARVPRADSRPLAARTGSWALLLRGVERLLSVLAVARA